MNQLQSDMDVLSNDEVEVFRHTVEARKDWEQLTGESVDPTNVFVTSTLAFIAGVRYQRSKQQ